MGCSVGCNLRGCLGRGLSAGRRAYIYLRLLFATRPRYSEQHAAFLRTTVRRNLQRPAERNTLSRSAPVVQAQRSRGRTCPADLTSIGLYLCSVSRRPDYPTLFARTRSRFVRVLSQASPGRGYRFPSLKPTCAVCKRAVNLPSPSGMPRPCPSPAFEGGRSLAIPDYHASQGVNLQDAVSHYRYAWHCPEHPA
ncbi:hypothetical protein BV20DRAFT_670092 [Pilatotrama ljubarskyi]|nr:hypothetical protein BV20DRAFT_670092 [Pilatotrama ljubarskyi]